MAQTTIQGSFLGDGTVTGTKIGADFISAQTALAAPDLVSTDEILVSDAGVIKRMDISVLEIAGTQITSGEVPPARLGSGSSITTKFLRGDGTWAAAGGPTEATKANMEAEATGTIYAPPDLVKNSPGVAKAWGFVSATGTLNAAHYNIDAVTVNGTGDWTFTYDTGGDMSSDAYIAVGGARSNNDLVFGFIYATGSIRLKSRDNTGGAQVDQAAGVVVYGESE